MSIVFVSVGAGFWLASALPASIAYTLGRNVLQQYFEEMERMGDPNYARQINVSGKSFVIMGTVAGALAIAMGVRGLMG